MDPNNYQNSCQKHIYQGGEVFSKAWQIFFVKAWLQCLLIEKFKNHNRYEDRGPIHACKSELHDSKSDERLAIRDPTTPKSTNVLKSATPRFQK